MDEGDRTLDNGSHNPVLYQLSYAHHIALQGSQTTTLLRLNQANGLGKALFGADEETRTLTPCGAGT